MTDSGRINQEKEGTTDSQPGPEVSKDGEGEQEKVSPEPPSSVRDKSKNLDGLEQDKDKLSTGKNGEESPSIIAPSDGEQGLVSAGDDVLTMVVKRQEAALKRLEDIHGPGYGKPTPGSKVQ